MLEELPRPIDRVLDVGCGHGRFAALLHAAGAEPAYLGVDASSELLRLAMERDDLPAACRWLQLDVLDDPDALPRGPFGLVTLFGVLHHVPGEARRHALLRALGERVAAGGTLALAFWRRAGDQVKRHLPWSLAGLREEDVEPGDRLLHFDGDERRFRYAHFADDAELDRVESAAGLPLALRFIADGQGNVANAYFLWRRRA